ncbi:protein of unknown function (plasmid) [Rhodovastum atsumiense]|nr:protein of unknown function [Rhodovastum atsumiense]
MSQPPARLTAGLVPVKKGEAAPVTPPPTPAPEEAAAEPTEAQAAPATAPEPSPPPAPRRSAPKQVPSSAPQLVREPPQQAPRVSVSARLPPELQEWIRVRAFVRRMPIQNLLEEIVEFYRQHHP